MVQRTYGRHVPSWSSSWGSAWVLQTRCNVNWKSEAKKNYSPFSNLFMLLLRVSTTSTKCHFCCYLTRLVTLKCCVICMGIEILACQKRAHLIAAGIIHLCVQTEKNNSWIISNIFHKKTCFLKRKRSFFFRKKVKPFSFCIYLKTWFILDSY